MADTPAHPPPVAALADPVAELPGFRHAYANVTADLVPNGGHAIGQDNPAWLAERLTRFFN